MEFAWTSDSCTEASSEGEVFYYREGMSERGGGTSGGRRGGGEGPEGEEGVE